jgi:hypothetical protein
MFCTPGVVSRHTEGIVSRFHVLRSQTRFRRYRERQVSFSSFALSDSFSAVPRASGPVFMFCAPEFIFSGLKGVGFRRTRHRQKRVRHILTILSNNCQTIFSLFRTVKNTTLPLFQKKHNFIIVPKLPLL